MSIIAAAREANGISQDKLAEIACVNRKTIIRIERDPGYSPSVRTAARIAEALGSSIDDLFSHQSKSSGTARSRVEIRKDPK